MSDQQPPKNHFSIEKLYVKDMSFESPTSPDAFKFKAWSPKIELNLANKHTSIDENLYEVVLTITATVNNEDKTAFLIEVQQAGLFAIAGFKDEERNYLLGSQCMNILLPYAREMISDMTTRGGFPPLILSPVNFEALYQQHLQKRKKDQEESVQAEASDADTVKH